MKTIQIPDELFNELKDMAHEVKTQDNRATANVYFQIKDKEKVLVPEGHGDFETYYNSDNEVELETIEEKKEAIFEHLTESLEKTKEEAESLISTMDVFDINLYLKLSIDYEIFEYSYKDVFKGAFLTEKEAKRHLEANKHHYSERAVVYGSSAWRNYDLQAIQKLLLKAEF